MLKSYLPRLKADNNNVQKSLSAVFFRCFATVQASAVLAAHVSQRFQAAVYTKGKR